MIGRRTEVDELEFRRKLDKMRKLVIVEARPLTVEEARLLLGEVDELYKIEYRVKEILRMSDHVCESKKLLRDLLTLEEPF